MKTNQTPSYTVPVFTEIQLDQNIILHLLTNPPQAPNESRSAPAQPDKKDDAFDSPFKR